ncbi:tetratricopeptide repeat protein [Blastococcus sp. SYSU DS0539]
MPAGPEIPEWADPRELDPAIRAALRGLDPRNSAVVAGHLVVAGTLVDEDPQTALAHARAARDRASRLAVVREAVGVAAYHAGDFAEAAREIRAYRRMSGDQGYRAVLADCERALGRPEVAIRLVNEALTEDVDSAETVELRLVEAGARRDLGEEAAARLVLEAALGGRPDPTDLRVGDEGRLRLAAAYADLLDAQGETARAEEWLGAVAEIDPELAGADLGVEFSELDDEELDEELDDELGDEESGGDDELASAVQLQEDDEPDEDPEGEAAELGDVEVHASDAFAADAEGAGQRRLSFDEEVEAEVAELLGETGDAEPDVATDASSEETPEH